MTLTNYAPALGPLWDAIEASGQDPELLFRELHIDPALRYNSNARVSFSKIEQIWRWISKTIDDPCIGLKMTGHWHPSAAGALGYAWLTSSSLRTAIGRLQRYSRLVNEGLEFSIKERKDEFSLVLAYREGVRGIPIWSDAILATVTTLCRANYGKNFRLASVSFSHGEPRCAGDFYGFFRCPVNFGTRDNRITLPVEVLDKRLSCSNPQLAQLNDQIMINYLAKLSDDNLIEKIKAVLIDLLPSGGVSDTKVADALYTSVRSLQRRLQQEGTTFKVILNEVREELAYKYLQDDRISLGEISFLLGFSEMSSFSRAFKRWKGVSPSAYKDAR